MQTAVPSNIMRPSEEVRLWLFQLIVFFSQSQTFITLSEFFPSFCYTEGPSLSPEEIISSYHVDNRPAPIECSLLCKNEPKCTGFNYRITIMNIENCQLTNITENKNPENSGEWTLLRDRNVVNKV